MVVPPEPAEAIRGVVRRVCFDFSHGWKLFFLTSHREREIRFS